MRFVLVAHPYPPHIFELDIPFFQAVRNVVDVISEGADGAAAPDGHRAYSLIECGTYDLAVQIATHIGARIGRTIEVVHASSIEQARLH